MSLARSRFSANLAMLYGETHFLDRFRRAAAAGFKAVEISTPELFKHDASAVRAALDEHGLSCVLFNMPAGAWADGERGIAALPGRADEFRDSVAVTAEYARALSCDRVHCLSGIAPHSAEHEHTYRESLGTALEELSPAGVEVLIEPINQRSIPGYYLRSFDQAASTIGAFERLGGGEMRPRLLFDLFHAQIIHGDVTMLLRKHREHIGHVQLAGVPDRAEPDEHNELNFAHLFRVLGSELRWEGHVGCEYIPRGETDAGLGWLRTVGLRDA